MKVPPKLYIPIAINTKKELLKTVIWADRNWTGFLADLLVCITSINPRILRIVTIQIIIFRVNF